MGNQKFKLEVTMIVEVEIDPENFIVKEYRNTQELLSDIVSYRFSSVLPVLRSGVKVDFEETSFKILEHEKGKEN